MTLDITKDDNNCDGKNSNNNNNNNIKVLGTHIRISMRSQ
jgi:hypothetical protein